MGVYHQNMDVLLSIITEYYCFLLVNLRTPTKVEIGKKESDLPTMAIPIFVCDLKKNLLSSDCNIFQNVRFVL